MVDEVLLGYELETGEEVHLPTHHLVVTGITRLSGKTTAVEGLLARGHTTALVILTKRGEVILPDAPRVRPFFMERGGWQYVSDVIEAALSEKMRIQRSTIIKVSRGSESLQDVYKNIVTEMEKNSTKGFYESILTELQAYLDIVIPKLEEAPLASSLDLVRDVTQVMDLSGYDDQVQSLIMRSVAEEIYQHRKGVTLVIPEAHRFIPQGANTPPKRVLEKLIREGGALCNWLWIDSQDIAGVDKDLLKQCDVWLLGRQRESNEAEHVVKQIPLPSRSRPKPTDVQTLGLGQFYATFANEVHKVYALPAWLDGAAGRLVALGAPPPAAPTRVTDDQEDDEMYRERAEVAEAREAELIRTSDIALEDVSAKVRTLKGEVASKTAEIATLKINNERFHELEAAEAREADKVEAIRSLSTDLAREKAAGLLAAQAIKELTATLERHTETSQNKVADLRAMDEVKDGLLHLLGSPNVGMGPSLDEEEIVERVLRRLADRMPAPVGQQPIVRMAPVPALVELMKGNVREKMLAAADLLLDSVRSLSPRQKQVLAMLAAADGAPLTIVEVARRVGYDIRGSGGSHGAWSKDMNVLVEGGFAENDAGRRGFRLSLDAKVSATLTYWEPTDEDLSAVRDNVLALVGESVAPRVLDSERS